MNHKKNNEYNTHVMRRRLRSMRRTLASSSARTITINPNR